jgi:hypothetical protein
MSNDVIAILTRKRIRIIIIANYTIHTFQILDVVLFDTLKKYATGPETLDEESQAAAFLLKVYCDFK